VQAPFRRLSSVVRGQLSATSNDTIWALKDASFEVQRGEVVGIIGRPLRFASGTPCGRNGGGQIANSKSEIRNPFFHPELSGRANITLNGAIPSICLRPELRPRAQDKPGDEESGDLS